MSLPTNYAITCSEFGGPEVLRWEEHPMPQPKANEVLIKVAAAGVNRADILQRKGKYPPPHGAGNILGMEVSGTIIACGGEASRWQVGDEVCALLSGGGYATYVTALAAQCLPVPQGISLRDAASLPETISTVWANIFDTGKLRPGESVLLHGGSSGIGTMGIQMAKAFGAKAYVTVRSDAKADACRTLGADEAINYNTHDFAAEVMQLTKGRGVDIVLDMVGHEYVARNLSILAPHGRHISIATQQGRMAEIDIGLVMQKRLTITGSTLRCRSNEEKASIIQAIEQNIWPLLAQKTIKPLVYKAYPIKNAAEAHKMMESSEHIGKILLEVAG